MDFSQYIKNNNYYDNLIAAAYSDTSYDIVKLRKSINDLIHSQYYSNLQMDLDDDQKSIIALLDEYIYLINAKQILEELLNGYIQTYYFQTPLCGLNDMALEYLHCKNNVPRMHSNTQAAKQKNFKVKSTITNNTTNILKYFLKTRNLQQDIYKYDSNNCIPVFYKYPIINEILKTYNKIYNPKIKFDTLGIENPKLDMIPTYSRVFLGYLFDKFKLREDESVSHNFISLIYTELKKVQNEGYKFDNDQFIKVVDKYIDNFNLKNALHTNYSIFYQHNIFDDALVFYAKDKYNIEKSNELFLKTKDIMTEDFLKLTEKLTIWYTDFCFERLYHFVFFNSLDSELFSLLQSEIDIKNILCSEDLTSNTYLSNAGNHNFLMLIMRFNINLNTVLKTLEKNESLNAKSSDYAFKYYLSQYNSCLYMILGRMHTINGTHLAQLFSFIEFIRNKRKFSYFDIINLLYSLLTEVSDKILNFENNLEIQKTSLANLKDDINENKKLYILLMLKSIVYI